MEANAFKNGAVSAEESKVSHRNREETIVEREEQPLWSLELPEPLVSTFEQYCKRFRVRKVRERRRIEEDLKLQFWYSGLAVACKETPRGRVVVASDRPNSPEVLQILSDLLPDERRRITIVFP